MSELGKVVCVTGASGYIASWLVKLLLLRGYTVRATVRNLSDPSKVGHLKALEGADERLQIFEADLIEEGSFDSVIDGCVAVFHTASPVILSPPDPKAELIEPAVKGTLNVMNSCSKASSVRRVVITSSIASVMFNERPKNDGVVVDETWFSDTVFCEEAKLWYPLAKTLAEQAAWKFARENGIDLVTMHPVLVIGPLLQPTPNFTSQLFLDIVKGKKVYKSYRFVDVRDVVNAHITAFENPSANGRYILFGAMLSHYATQHMLHKLYPSINVPLTETEEPTYEVSKKRAESLGINFMPLEVSIKDTVESLKERNFLTI